MLEQISAGAARGAKVFAQSTTRGIGVLFGFVNRTPFDRAPSWRALRNLRLEEKGAKLRNPEYRATMVREALADPPPIDFSQIFVLPADEVRYDHHPEESLQAHADRLGVSPMDASLPTYFLKYWVQERQHFTLEQAIRKLTLDPAQLFGIQDRGVIRQGACADLNVIDYDHLRVPPPTFVYDLPAGAGRYIQKSSGYQYTLVNGQVFMEGLEHTGVFAGQVLRSA